MKKIFDLLCVIISLILVVVGIILSVNDYGIDNQFIFPAMFIIGCGGLLLQLHYLKTKK